MRALVVVAPVLFAPLLFTLACVPSVSLEGRPCPCADGYQCCDDVCIAESATCSALTPSDGGTEERADGGNAHDAGDTALDGGDVDVGADGGAGEDGGAGGASYVGVGCGGNHTCMIEDTGRMFCLGGYDQGQTEYPSGYVFVDVDLGYRHSCGLTDEGFAICFGAGEINSGSPLNSGQSIPPNDKLSAVSAGKYHSCGLKASDGTVLCWGTVEGTIPAGSYAQVSAGTWHTCLLDAEGAATCFGGSSDVSSPPSEARYRAIAAGNNVTCAAEKETGALECFGNFNDYGGLEPPEGAFDNLALGAFHGCALATDGHIACWGAGQHPDLDNTAPHYGQARPPEGSFVDVAAGDSHSCGVSADGAVMCWGMNINGQSPERLHPSSP